MKKIRMLLLIIWLIVIFVFSQESGIKSTDRSIEIASTIVNDYNTNGENNIKDEQTNIIKKYELVIRKGAHLLEYIILGILMIIVVKDYKKLTIKVCLLVLLGSFLYACSDEIHQYFVPGRDSSYIDILIDTVGSFIGISIYYLIYINKEKSKKL